MPDYSLEYIGCAPNLVAPLLVLREIAEVESEFGDTHAEVEYAKEQLEDAQRRHDEKTAFILTLRNTLKVLTGDPEWEPVERDR
jgi:hypothetical protein